MARLLAAVMVLAATAAACSDTGSGAAKLAIDLTEPTPGQVHLEAPASVAAGLTEVTLRNAATQAHDVQLVRVDGTHAAEEVLDVIRVDGGPVPPWLHAEGGVGTVGPGAANAATVVLTPGLYYLVDTAAQAGGVRPLTVAEGDGRPARPLPRTAASITAHEYAFDVAQLKAGRHDVRFENRGTEPHVVVAIPIRAGSTIDDVRRQLTGGGPAGGAPAGLDFARGTGAQPLEGGKALVTQMTLVKGRYALACFLSDRAGGPPHFALGMLQEFTVG